MKEKNIASPESNLQVVERHFQKLDWETVWSAATQRPYPWEGLMAVLSGVKPSFYFYDTDVEVVDLDRLIPPSIKHKFLEIGEADKWLFDKNAVRGIMKNMSREFRGLKVDQLDNDNYLADFLTGLNNRWKHKQAGLLLGYDTESVYAFANGIYGTSPKMRGFSYRSYQFACLKKTYTSFLGQIESRYQNSGLQDFEERLKLKIKAGFSERVMKTKDTVSVLNHKDGKFLEIEFVDRTGSEAAIVYQLMHLQSNGNTRPAIILGKILNERKKRKEYYIGEFKGKNIMGNEFENYLHQMKWIEDKKRLGYVQMTDTAEDSSVQVMHISRAAMRTFARQLKDSLGEDVGKYLR